MVNAGLSLALAYEHANGRVFEYHGWDTASWREAVTTVHRMLDPYVGRSTADSTEHN